MSTSKKASVSTEINYTSLIHAIKQCIIGNLPIKSTAKKFNIPRSSLQRYLKKVREKFDDLSSVGDDVLLDFVRDCNKRTPSNMVC